MDERMTNGELGTLLDLSHVTISRLRSGTRLPSVEAMVRIEEVLGWKVQDQVEARKDSDYAAKFEDAVTRYASSRNTAAGPEESAPPAPH